MDTKAYIASGILELYVAGQLSEKENQEVAEYANQYPEIKAEIIQIENAILSLAAASAPKKMPSFSTIKDKLNIASESKVVPLDSNERKWTSHLGWAASAILAVGLVISI